MHLVIYLVYTAKFRSLRVECIWMYQQWQVILLASQEPGKEMNERLSAKG